MSKRAAETAFRAGWRRSIGLAAIAAAAWLLASPTAAQQQGALRRDKSLGLSLTTGADFSSGRYGAAADTDILVVPLSLRARKADQISATLPYLRLDGPANIVGGGESGPIVIDPTAPTPRRVREGLGDLSLGVDRDSRRELAGRARRARHRNMAVRYSRRLPPSARQAAALLRPPRHKDRRRPGVRAYLRASRPREGMARHRDRHGAGRRDRRGGDARGRRRIPQEPGGSGAARSRSLDGLGVAARGASDDRRSGGRARPDRASHPTRGGIRGRSPRRAQQQARCAPPWDQRAHR